MDNAADKKELASVTLGGQLWPVPVLNAKQNKIIDPLILGLLPLFSGWQDDRAGTLAKFGAAQYDALLEIAYVAVSRMQPDLTRAAFLDLPITLPELIVAFGIIAQQTGIFQNAPGETPPGEAAGV